MKTTLLNFRVTDQVKDDFMTTCKLNCTSMTSEIVMFMNQYILNDCILVVLCRQNDNKEDSNNGRELDPDISEVDFSINSPIEIEYELFELSDQHE